MKIKNHWLIAIGAVLPGVLKYLILGECKWNSFFHPEKECALKVKRK